MILVLHLPSEVLQKICFHLVFVQEPELLIYKGLCSDATDSLCFYKHVIIELPFHFILGT